MHIKPIVNKSSLNSILINIFIICPFPNPHSTQPGLHLLYRNVHNFLNKLRLSWVWDVGGKWNYNGRALDRHEQEHDDADDDFAVQEFNRGIQDQNSKWKFSSFSRTAAVVGRHYAELHIGIVLKCFCPFKPNEL